MAVIFFKLDRPPSRSASLTFVVTAWIFLIIIITVPASINGHPSYYGINAPWVRIRSSDRSFSQLTDMFDLSDSVSSTHITDTAISLDSSMVSYGLP
jgi:hypothetical protein